MTDREQISDRAKQPQATSGSPNEGQQRLGWQEKHDAAYSIVKAQLDREHAAMLANMAKQKEARLAREESLKKQSRKK